MENEIITENDKIYDIIKKYPVLKDVLISINPIYKRLSNPIMFNTVAKITTVKQAAKVGKIYTKQLLYELNEAIGKGEEFLKITKKDLFKAKADFLNKAFSDDIHNNKEPEWFKNFTAATTFDYSTTDEEPFLKVTEFAKTLQKGSGFILIQNFKPLPLINYLKSLGFDAFIQYEEEGKYKIYFYKVKEDKNE